MKKYWLVFRLSWARQFEYRFNLLLWRLKNIVVLLLLFYVWKGLAIKTGNFAGYSESEIITYVFAALILRSVIFGNQSAEAAREINTGDFSAYLVRPVNYFWFNFWRELAQRTINFISSVFEAVIFAGILGINFFAQTNWLVLSFFALSVLLAAFLYFLLSHLINLSAFFSREAMGPKWLFEMIAESASGTLFPLDILPAIFFIPLAFLPFLYLIFFPIGIYLEKISFWQAAIGICAQIVWILIIGSLTKIVWKKGLERYSGEGI